MNNYKAKLIYSMIMSLDGYTEDKNGQFGWGAPENEAVHAYINQLGASIGTNLYGRKMYETMLYWETAHTIPDQPQVVLDWAKIWRTANKIVYSKTLTTPRSERTQIKPIFDPEAIRALKENAKQDIAVAGPELAGQALRAGLVDEIQMIICPIMIGGGTRFFPEDVRLPLELVEERQFENGVMVLRYAVHNQP